MAAADADEEFVREAIALAGQARERGDHPFGALLVLDGAVVLSAMNSVATDKDPTAHAETNLVAEAVKRLSADQIARAVLYTSCEPCAMCVGKMYWAGIRSVVYGLSSEDLASMTGGDFLIPCRELFERAKQIVDVKGPLLSEEAEAVHLGFW
jgi:tRNA(Arg) A34 adenosine deaminase TadA